jgi:hypothetical protein
MDKLATETIFALTPRKREEVLKMLSNLWRTYNPVSKVEFGGQRTTFCSKSEELTNYKSGIIGLIPRFENKEKIKAICIKALINPETQEEKWYKFYELFKKTQIEAGIIERDLVFLQKKCLELYSNNEK